MARNKKPESEKRASGNPGKRKIAPEPEVDIIVDATPPDGMDEKQTQYWNEYAPLMIQAGLLTQLNRSDLRRLCSFEVALDSVLEFLAQSVTSMVQEKKNYHGDVVDLVESTYSKIARNYAATIRTLKADLKLRTDKMPGTFKPKAKPKDNAFSEF